MKLSQVTPCQVLPHSPYTLSTLKGADLDDSMVIKVPCFRNYIAHVGSLVESGEILKVGKSYYLTTSQQSPRVPRLPSIPIEYDIEEKEWREAHLPTIADID